MALNNIFTSEDRVTTDPMIINKMKHMILFFIEQCPGHLLGKTKLMKLLYFADFDHFDDHRESISNATYYKFEHGPVPVSAFDLLEQMNASNEIEMRPDPMYPKRISFKSNREFDPSVFSPDECDTLVKVAETWRTASKEQIETASHLDPPWVAAGRNNPIPYELVLYRNTHGDMDIDDDDSWGDGE